MINYIQGIIIRQAKNFLVIETHGLGYQVFVSQQLSLQNQAGQNIQLHIYHHYTETQNSLFGFETLEDLEFFEKLISVSGIGPKIALGFFSTGKVAQIAQAIVNEDIDFLTSLPGLGRKTAERLSLELKNKLAVLPTGDAQSASEQLTNEEALQALITLGYSPYQAKRALTQVDSQLNLSEQIKQALQIISK